MIYYKKEGKGEALFFLHGFPNNHTIWKDIWPSFSDKFEIFLPDLPGVGRSPFIKEDLSLDFISLEIEKIMLFEQIEKAIFIGHSMGGYAALNFAGHFPEKVKALTLIHSTAADDSESRKKNRLKAINLMNKGELGKIAFLKAMSHNLFSSSFQKNNEETVKGLLESWKLIDVKSLVSLYNAITFRPSKIEVLQNARFSIQWIIGNEDTATPMQDMLEEVHIAKVNDIKIYNPCGHMAMIEFPEKLIKDLKCFLNFVFEQ